MEFLVGAGVATFELALDRLAPSDIWSYFKSRNFDVDLLKKLNLYYLTVESVLNDAEEKQFTNKNLKKWVAELQDAVYEADDLIDEINTVALRSTLEAESQSSSSNQVRDPTFSSTDINFDEKMEDRIKKMIDRLKYFVDTKAVFGLRGEIGGSNSFSDQRLPTTSLVDESTVYGVDSQKEAIMEILLSDHDSSSNDNIGVIPLVGMGGIGKTTLAQLVYNDSIIVQHFDLKAWVCVSEEFDVVRVTKTILEAISSQPTETSDLNILQIKLREKLQGKKFLLVLDDVWSEKKEDWDVLRKPIRAGANGSKVIVTTRSDNVASVMQTVPIHNLEYLSFENCWSLFMNHAFASGDLSRYPNLKAVGEEIVKKCGGLPLAVKALGGMLRRERNFEKWDDVLKSEMWMDQSNILPVLRLSYHYLPSHLKRCFSFCSIFCKDYQFKKKKLVQLWIALNFVQKPEGGKLVEETGYYYFDELLARSLFQRSDADSSRYMMHDLVHDLAESISGEFCFRLEHDKLNVSKKVRHFSYLGDRTDVFQKFEALTDAKGLRTFLRSEPPYRSPSYLSNRVLNDLLPGLRCLRVLSLSDYRITELSDSIDNLVHLRYLNLSRTEIRQLPDSITNLCNLQMLLLKSCFELEKLPAKMGKLVHLFLLDISETELREMPPQMSKLKDLQVLTYFVVGKHSGSRINELGQLLYLCGTLSIRELQNVSNANDALEAKLKDKKHLEGLVLKWGADADDSRHERDVLDKLRPPANLKALKIENYGGTSFPSWLSNYDSFSNIVSLHLKDCNHCFDLPSLGQFQSLKELTIARMEGITKVRPEFYGNGCSSIKSFQSLKILRFDYLIEWKEWHILDGGDRVFSCLEELSIINCPKLTGGFPKNLPSLVKFEMSGCHPQFVELSKELSSGLIQFSISRCEALESLHRGMMCSNTCLKAMTIDDCSSLVSLPVGDLPITLRVLHIRRCQKLELRLPDEVKHPYTSLEQLKIDDSCDSLKTFPLGFFPKLRSLALCNCLNLESLSIPDGHPDLTSLDNLLIGSCPNMAYFPEGGLPAPNMFVFVIDHCGKLKSLPARMHALLPSVQYLSLIDCPEIESLPVGGLPSTLNHLTIRSCDKLMVRTTEWGLHRLPSLKTFKVGDGKLSVEAFPDESLLPSTLNSLEISNISNLKSLNGKALRHLTSLENLSIQNCPEIQSLPEEELPPSLFSLFIGRCPLLKQRCQREKGQDWPKISHVGFIEIDGKVHY